MSSIYSASTFTIQPNSFEMTSNLRVVNDAEASRIISKLRNESLKPAVVRRLVRELTTALTPYALKPPCPGEQIAVVVILRSGLAMADPFLAALPEDADVVVHHLGLFREKESLRPVEYYNKLPLKSPRIKRAYILDPLVATGGTAKAATNILK